jgi:hypothetical protein
MKIALLLFSILTAEAAFACSITVADPPQELVHSARGVAEVVARREANTYDVVRVWKGALSATLVLPPPDTGSTCGGPPPFVPGKRYLVLLYEEPPAEVIDIDSAAAILRYLSAPQRVSTRDLLKMLRGWNRGTVTDSAMARWLRDLVPVAEVDDWTVFAHEEELADQEDGVSLVLRTMVDLNRRINQENVPLAELTCELRVLRTRVVPAYIQLLAHPPRTLDEIDAFEMQFEELDGLEDQLCDGSSEPSSSPVSGFMSGNQTTSRRFGASVSSATKRSMPMPQPEMGGMPNSIAVR